MDTPEFALFGLEMRLVIAVTISVVITDRKSENSILNA